MTASLHPHHLLCILTYSGHGYSPAFSANMTRIAGRLGAGERVEIVARPDDICGPLLDDPDSHCRRASVTAWDRAAARELVAGRYSPGRREADPGCRPRPAPAPGANGSIFAAPPPPAGLTALFCEAILRRAPRIIDPGLILPLCELDHRARSPFWSMGSSE